MKEDIDLREGEAPILFGPRDRHLRITRESFGVHVVARGNVLMVEGDPASVRPALRAFGEMLGRIRSSGTLHERDVFEIIQAERARLADPDPMHLGVPVAAPATPGIHAPPPPALESHPGDDEPIDPYFRVVPRTAGQRHYIQTIRDHDVVLAVGPAGTGKTYLAAAMAIAALRKGLYRRMVLARPAVEAGERLGFLPGDFQAKVSPYLRPLYDALNDLLDVGQLKTYMERDVIEVSPLAYMRGRTLDRSFIILDEAQNTTRPQLKMVLTRLGRNSVLVVTGDDTQIDLPEPESSGLLHAWKLLEGVPGIGRVRLGREDIVRHRLVQDIVDAYDRDDARSEGRSP
jgi:phosphate starvation-inducible PhoH-like protein